MILKDGLRRNEQNIYEFDYEKDLEDDLIYLCKGTYGVRNADDISYFHAYEFNPNADLEDLKNFRKAFKTLYNDDTFFYKDSVSDFIELGMLRMDKYKKLTDFDIVFMTDFGHGDSAGVMSVLDSLLLEYTDGSFLDIRLVKEAYENVKFDVDKAVTALMKTVRYSNESDARKAARSIEKRFIKLKDSGEMFKMKMYLPVAGRAGFYDFLKFDTSEHKDIFSRMLSGTEALICDDFITSGSTVKEIKRYLHSINPNVNLTVFILVDQLRSY